MMRYFFIIHAAICVLAICLLWGRKRTDYRYLIPAILCVPVGGLVLYLLERYLERHDQFDSRMVDLDKLKIEDVKYQRINVDEDEDVESTVPLGEAMQINDSSVKRSLLMKVLDKKPERSINLLQEARMGTDTEITHYATTTMAQIQADYEKRLQELNEASARMPDNVKLLNCYRRELQKYIASGLITGNILLIYRRQLEHVLARQIQLSGNNIRLYMYRVENQLELGAYDGIEEELREMRQKWPCDERSYQTAMKYYWHRGRGSAIQELLREIEEKNIYLSRSGQEWFAFWSRSENQE